MNFKRVLCALLSATLLTAGCVYTAGSAYAVEINTQNVGAKADTQTSKAGSYGLADTIQDGVILHCFNWKYNDIKAELPKIAEAGFTSIQTSPAQRDSSYGVWYMMYQPQGFSIAQNALGTKADLEALCAEAESYGIKVVVDVVANHLRGSGYDVDDYLSRGKHPEFFHGNDSGIDYGNRYSITHNDLGMADLNSENAELQKIVADYIEELQKAGVDGIRWDAAKHISVPSEGCDFWKTVTAQGLWHYGEILGGPGGDNEALMKEYTGMISVTDSDYGKAVRDATEKGGLPSSTGNWCNRGVSKNRLVYWAESHDTYSNDGSYGEASQFIDQNKIDRAWAIVAAQNDATALYFSRPGSTSKESIMAGAKGSTHYECKEVAEVNIFHNAMIGKKDYYAKGDNVAAVTREGGGAVIVTGSGSGQITVENGGGYCPEGTYTDMVSGGIFTVTSSTISGTVGDSGIAVIYDPKDVPITGARVSATSNDSSFTSSTLTVTLNLRGATTGSYSTSEGATGTFSDGDKITIGGKTDVTGTSKTITITLKATGEDGKEVSKTYTYTKSDPNLKTYIYFDNSSYNWSSVYAYVYDNSSGTAKELAKWPGVQMTEKDAATGYLKLDVESVKNGQVIFSDGTNSNDKRYPADMEPGLKIGGSSKLFSAGNSWKDYSAPVDDTDTGDDTDTQTDSDTDVEVEVLLGDANQDGEVSLRDATMVLKHVAGVSTLSGKALAAADVDENGSVTTADSVTIQRYDIGYASTNSNGHAVGSKVKLVVK